MCREKHRGRGTVTSERREDDGCGHEQRGSARRWKKRGEDRRRGGKEDKMRRGGKKRADRGWKLRRRYLM